MHFSKAHRHHSIQPVWLEAALLGSVWASIEIVLGSFLHNLGVPLAGTILAAISVCLLTAGSRFYKEHGVIWRAGAICALMKSISPSAVILGPMIGIMSEALVLELFLAIFRKHPAGMILGGMAAMTTPLLQKIIGFLFVYGTDIAALYGQMFAFAARSLHIESFEAMDLLALLFAVNMSAGAMAAAFGLVVGRRATALSAELPETLRADLPQALPAVNPAQTFSVWLLFAHFAVLIAGLWFLNDLPLYLSPVLVLAYLFGCTRLYPRAWKRLQRPRLWIELIAIALLASVLLGGISGGGWNTRGLETGVLMTLRAVLFIIVFTAVSVELRNPVIIGFFLRRGIGEFSKALDVAFEALPTMTAALGAAKGLLRHPVDSIARVLAVSAAWLDSYVARGRRTPPVFIVTGQQGEGKTSFVRSVIGQLRARAFTAGGILAPGFWENNKRAGFDVVNLRTNESTPLCRIDYPESGVGAGPFKFSLEGIAFGHQALSAAGIAGAGIVVIDEIGPLELRGKGWAEPLERILSENTAPVLLVVRSGLVDDAAAHWQFTPHAVWMPGTISAEHAAAEILRALEE